MASARRIVFVFVDGLGLGPEDDPANPLGIPGLDLLANFRSPAWIPLADGGRPATLPAVLRRAPLPYSGVVRATDPSLGVTGLPQSATGQTAILTGVNAAEILGRHLYGYPTRTLQKILLESSVFRRAVENRRSAVFVNAFRPLFFELGDAVWTRGMSATTWANRAAGLPFRSLADLAAGRAVYQDITHDSLSAQGVSVPFREPEDAGRILAAVAAEHDFTLFEFFQTDKAGHSRDRDKATRELLKLERFLAAALAALDLETTLLILTSDHGNVEDLSVKSHTHNPVPTLAFGSRASAVAERLERLESFTPVLLDILGGTASPEA